MNQEFLFPMPSGDEQRPRDAAPLSHRHDPSTSREAATQFKQSGKLGLHRQIVLDGVKRCNGGTHSEIAAGTPLDWLQVARRLSELERRGLVKKGQPRLCRVKDSRCTTWWIVEAHDTSVDAPDGHFAPLETTNGPKEGNGRG